MFGKDKKPQFETIEVCKYCDSENITKLTTSTGFGGGYVYTENPYYSKIFLCKDCGRITDKTQFKKKELKYD